MHRQGGEDRLIRRFSLQLNPFGSHVRFGSPFGRLSRVRTAMSSEELLRRLNGQTIETGAKSWRIDVYSIVNNDAHRWVQVGLEGADRRTVLLKMEYLADDEDARSAIEDWVGCSSALHGGVIVVPDSD